MELLRKAMQLAVEPVSREAKPDYRLLRRLKACDRELRRLGAELLAALSAGMALAPEENWLLDNYSAIHSQVREVQEAMPRGYYRLLPRLRDGLPRVYRLAEEIVAPDGEVSIEAARAFFHAYQEITFLTLAELWAIEPMLKLALIEKLCDGLRQGLEPVVRDVINTLRSFEAVAWSDFVESLSVVDRILERDPAGVYAHMDFPTRDAYRHSIEGTARGSGFSEIRVAELAVALARESDGSDWRKSHVGYYLTGEGVEQLKACTACRTPATAGVRKTVYASAGFLYVGGLLLLTLLLLAGVWWSVGPLPWICALLLLLPASQAAVALLNPLVTLLIPPRGLPRLDFSHGIPEDCRAFVVVPTLLLSRAAVEKLLERLEIHYLANRDPNLYFALLTDSPDSSTRFSEHDTLLELCAEGIRLLNQRHGVDGRAPFYLFHRARQWNESESVWMGHERKRGKLEDFNALLLGEADAFETKLGDLSVLSTIRYVITLDSDTQLPRDTARKLVATLAHPLNRPLVDPETRTVREGFAILQPRVSISMESAARSHLARIYSGQTGFDPYTTAVSDVYQDLHGQASYTGKGIYDVEAFHRTLHGRFPENAILSHDLIEGEHGRVGLVTDLEVIDDYPATYQAYSKRKHRWVRGDWQLLPWLLPRVPAGDGSWQPNPLPGISRWKILDNLRRSLLEVSFLALLVGGWFFAPHAAAWTLTMLALLLFPVYVDLPLWLLRLPPPRFWRSYIRDCASRFARGHLDVLLNLVFLPHQACLMADAVVRTLVRLSITRRRLLEWESMAQVEAGQARERSRISLPELYLNLTPLLALLVTFGLLRAFPPPPGSAVLLLNLWILSPLAALWINGAPARPPRSNATDEAFLRDLALRTWRYFADYGGPEDHWLAPDNVQEDPPAVARRTSPTNLGLQLTANLAALDFGYITPLEFTMRLDRMLETMSQMERHRGHFLNWYDARTLLALQPRSVSTVDSGNLAASLLALKQGCLELLRRELVDASALEGLRDHCLRLRDALPAAARSAALMRLIESLVKQLEYRPTDLFFWEGVLSEAHALTRRIGQHLDETDQQDSEASYWYRVLAERVETALHDLCALAPWLAEPFETELRMASGHTRMAGLMRELCRVPRIAELPAGYDAIEQAIGRVLHGEEALHPSTRRVLELLRDELEISRRNAGRLIRDLRQQAEAAGAFARAMDFRFLFDSRRKLLHLGYDTATGALDESYYDLLASEARSAVFVAIAKGDLPREAWFHLGRKLTCYRGHRTLLSWSGTLFEYLMPLLYMRSYEHTLLGESLHAAVRIQRLYCAERRVPWGISEAAFSDRNSGLSYQYQAFGVPFLGMKRRLGQDLVIAPYASALALMVDRQAATENLRHMAAKGWMMRYGFFESVDYTARRAGLGRHIVIRAFMAHHQGMTLVAVCNALLDGVIQRRFHSEPAVLATEFLLQERLPALLSGIEAEQLPLANLPLEAVARQEIAAARGTIATPTDG